MSGVDCASKNKTVLVVEDDARTLTVVSQMLRLAGYRVLEAAGPESAIDCFKDRAADIDLLLSDWQMPGIDGQTLGLQFRATKPELPVVIMTGHSGPECPAGALQKPFAMAELYRKVAETLATASHS
jgi:two-component system, cell cycle sensor histidine kinase and response regulator CckA